MLMKWLILAVFFVTTILAAEPSNQYRTPHCYPIVRNLPIYQLDADGLSSTAVLVGPNTWATSAHGVKRGKAKKIILHLPDEVRVKVTWFDVDKDIAVLSGNSGNIRPIDGMSFDLAEHEQVWNIGYAGMAAGELMSFTGFQVRYNKINLLVVSALGLSGMSGGASVRCVEGRVELIGIITALVNHQVEMKVWTDEQGILHTDRTLVNKGISLVTPIRFEKTDKY